MLLAILLILVALGVLTLLYAWLIERNWFALRTHRIPCLPRGSQPVRLLHVSDLHYRKSLRAMPRFLRRLRSVQPDLVVGTGDFLGERDAGAECAELLGAIPSKHGGIFVLGSNDYYAPVPKSPLVYFRKKRPRRKHGPRAEWRPLVEGLEARGWKLLLNETATIDGVDVVGLDDPHIKRHKMEIAAPRSSHDRFRLAVVHSPEVAHELAERGFDLIMCGHTHGGQVRMPLAGAIVTNAGELPRRMARGVHRIGDAWLHVNAGLGTSKYAPIRFFCRPEACVLELVERER